MYFILHIWNLKTKYNSKIKTTSVTFGYHPRNQGPSLSFNIDFTIFNTIKQVKPEKSTKIHENISAAIVIIIIVKFLRSRILPEA